MVRDRDSEAGFTLLEMLTVIVIIGVLAAVAIPAFTSTNSRGKAKAEVTAFFAELSIREEQYRVDRGTYLAAAKCPSTPSTSLQSMTACVTSGTEWGPNLGTAPAQQRLNVQLPMEEGYCTYQIVTGTGAGTAGPAGFTFVSPTGPWYYIHATCDMDGNTANTSEYFSSSKDSTIQDLNVGQ
jgi:prepilin-type N-terminal cleavage/methylation domain-containing protein